MLDGLSSVNQAPTRLIAQREYVDRSELQRPAEKNPFDDSRQPVGEQKDVATFSIDALIKAFETNAFSETGANEEFSGSKDPFKTEKPENKTVEDDGSGLKLSDEEKALVEELKSRDREVRAHEQAHMNAGAGIVSSGASFTYKTGPDEQRYAVGGEVNIDTSEGRTPEETIAKAEKIKRAALAPARPSGADRAVAAEAAAMANRAHVELARQKAQEADQQPAPVSNFNDGTDQQAQNFLT